MKKVARLIRAVLWKQKKKAEILSQKKYELVQQVMIIFLYVVPQYSGFVENLISAVDFVDNELKRDGNIYTYIFLICISGQGTRAARDYSHPPPFITFPQKLDFYHKN